ncbi:MULTISPECIES: hypothetical protein [unclassified Nonomuraea]|uniref:hypothetical protein n=1 Tax=unclassified Nonomuraea TaxID=2593643 RepID=UPI0033EFBFD2
MEQVAKAVRADLGVAGYEAAYTAGAALSHLDALAPAGMARDRRTAADDLPGTLPAVGA